MGGAGEVYVGVRAEPDSVPPVPSERCICSDCKAGVWVELKSLDFARSCELLLCVECMLRRAREEAAG